MTDKLVITPWEIKGSVMGVDYEKLMREFGADPLTDQVLSRMKKHTGQLHVLLRRKFFVSHRDLGWLLDEFEKGNKFYIYTGRGPSGPMHLGHLLPFMLCKWLQDRFGAEMWIQMSDDEKFLVKPDMKLEDAQKWTEDNLLDIIALGFDPKKTHIFVDTKNAKTMYPHAVRVAKLLNLSTAKSVFGFTGETNVGIAFYTAMQSVLAFLPSALSGKQIPCLVPLGLDQDPHFRVCRDIMPKLGYHKPAVLHAKFLSGLGEGGKMSASLPNSAIYLTDSEKVVADKIKRHAFSGGQKTAEEQRKLGANPEIDVSYQWLQAFFEDDDERIKKIHEEYKSGRMLTSELKQILIDKVNAFLKNHQAEREKAKDKLDKFLWKD